MLCRGLARRDWRLHLTEPVISFSFDDFPSNALHVGGRILRSHGVSATYYVSMGLMGTLAPTGRMFDRADLDRVTEEHHELGCHTFHHAHAWDTRSDVFARSIDENARALKAACTDARLLTLSYPISCPRPGNKRAAAARFECCRGGGQCPNVATFDRNYAHAYFLEMSGGRLAAIEQHLETTLRRCGWLILATHDVDPHPTRYGVTPEFLESVAQKAARSGARLLPVGAAWQHISRSAGRKPLEGSGGTPTTGSRS